MTSSLFFSGLKPNKEKCEVAGIGVKKGVKVEWKILILKKWKFSEFINLIQRIIQYFTLLNVWKTYKATMKNYLNKFQLERNMYLTKFLYTQIFLCFSTKFWIIFSFSISHFLSLKSVHHHCVLFATLWMKRHSISSILVILQSDYGTNFNILFISIFIFLKSLHRVPASDYLISAVSNRIFY